MDTLKTHLFHELKNLFAWDLFKDIPHLEHVGDSRTAQVAKDGVI